MTLNLTLYALDNITDYRQFERLCSDLMFREGHKQLKPHGGFHDYGIDVLIHVHEADPRIIFQYSTQLDYKGKIGETVEKLKRHNEACSVLHYVTNREVPYSTAKQLIKDINDEHGIVLEMYDREWLRLRLDNDSKDLREKYLGVKPESESAVEYRHYWETTADGKQACIVEIDWLDQSDVAVIRTKISALPGQNQLRRFDELAWKGLGTFPSLLMLEWIGAMCQYYIHTQSIEDKPVINTVKIEDTSDEKRDTIIEFRSERLVELPETTTVIYLLNYVPGVCTAIMEKLDKEISLIERI